MAIARESPSALFYRAEGALRVVQTAAEAQLRSVNLAGNFEVKPCYGWHSSRGFRHRSGFSPATGDRLLDTTLHRPDCPQRFILAAKMQIKHVHSLGSSAQPISSRRLYLGCFRILSYPSLSTKSLAELKVGALHQLQGLSMTRSCGKSSAWEVSLWVS